MHSELAESQAMSREALAIREKVLGTNDPVVQMTVLRIQAVDLDMEGRSSEEEAALYKLVALRRQIDGDEHADVAQSLNMLASVLKNNGKLAESETIRRQALAIQEKALGGENAEVAQTLENLGDLLILENKLADAEPFLRSSYTMRRKMFGDFNALTAGTMVDFGTLLEAEGKIVEATNLFLAQAGNTSGSAASADYCLGQMYLQGTGVEKNPEEGASWMLQSALQGHSDAEIAMGVLYYQGTGVPRDEAQSMAWFKKAGAGNEVTAMKALANCYCVAGHPAEALATLKSCSIKHPQDTDASLTLATWQAWFKKKDGYEATRQRILDLAADTPDATVAQSAAKAYCLKPSTNLVLLARALDLARMGAQFRIGTIWLPWYQLSLGMVEYRLGRYAEAETNFSTAEQIAGKFQDVVPTARLYRAMCLFQQGQTAEARALFSETETQMTPLPEDPKRPVIDGKAASHDVIISWLAYREAKALLYDPHVHPNGL